MALLNFVLPKALGRKLDTYSEQTGRSASDVVRQLVVELLEGDRNLPAPREHPNGRRTNVQLTERLLEALEAHVGPGQPHGTKAALIAALLEEFLGPRTVEATFVTATIRLSGAAFSHIYERYGPGPVSSAIERFIEAHAATREGV